jgi:hypothetical protein
MFRSTHDVLLSACSSACAEVLSLPRLDEASGMLHYDVHDESDLAELIRTGLIWRGGPKTQRLAVALLLTGRVPVNDRVPLAIAAFVRAKLANRDGLTSDPS